MEIMIRIRPNQPNKKILEDNEVKFFTKTFNENMAIIDLQKMFNEVLLYIIQVKPELLQTIKGPLDLLQIKDH